MTQPKIANKPDDSLKNFSPTDPRYTVNEQFPPNKEGTWPYPKEKCGWMMVHNALRGEIIQFQDTLTAIKARRGTLKAWEVECIQDVFIAHLYNMEEHHSQLDKASEIVKSLKVGDDVATTIASLSHEFGLYKESIFPHFAEEEM
jgi:glutamate synthase domain-containing protein 1